MVEKVQNTEQFIQKAKNIWNEQYYYGDFTVYTKSKQSIKIGCYEHGIVTVCKAGAHIRQGETKPSGCPKCGREISLKTCFKSLTNDEYINRAEEKWVGRSYDYSNMNYTEFCNKINIYCNKHKMQFEIIAQNHLYNKYFSGCQKCDEEIYDTMKCYQKLPFEEFEETSNYIHNNKYRYFKDTFNGSHKKTDIECPIHGTFNQLVKDHIYKKIGCPKCKQSTGELKIMKYLDSKNIKYITQFKINKSIWDEHNEYSFGIDNISEFDKQIKNKLFDFFVPSFDKNVDTLIEFDGEQHFKPIKHFGGIEKFKKQKENDKIKNEYCLANNMKLIRISYVDYDNIEKILNDLFFI